MAYTGSFSIQWIAFSLWTLFLLFTTFQSDAFAPHSILPRKQSSYSPSNTCFGVLEMKGGPTDKEGTDSREGFLGGIKDFFSNLDAVADDFFYKRMGKGEIFYGKRRYKPSGNVEGEYQGMGLSDKLKIDMAREYREEWLEEKRMRDEIKMLREQKEQREE